MCSYIMHSNGGHASRLQIGAMLFKRAAQARKAQSLAGSAARSVASDVRPNQLIYGLQWAVGTPLEGQGHALCDGVGRHAIWWQAGSGQDHYLSAPSANAFEALQNCFKFLQTSSSNTQSILLNLQHQTPGMSSLVGAPNVAAAAVTSLVKVAAREQNGIRFGRAAQDALAATMTKLRVDSLDEFGAAVAGKIGCAVH